MFCNIHTAWSNSRGLLTMEWIGVSNHSVASKPISITTAAWIYTQCFFIMELHMVHKERLNAPYCSPNIIRVITARWMRWVGHVARMGEESCIHGFGGGGPDSNRPLGRPRRNLSIILNLIFKKWGGEAWISGTIKCGAFVEQLKSC
jgi:hypothetical protein